MKVATIPSLRVEPQLRQAAEQVLEDGESLSGFVEQSIRESIERRVARRDFITRGLGAAERARQSGLYADADTVIAALQDKLERTRVVARTR